MEEEEKKKKKKKSQIVFHLPVVGKQEVKEKQDGKFMLEPRGSARRQRLQFREVPYILEAVFFFMLVVLCVLFVLSI